MSKITLILVEPTHAGNIGAVARAMKNMGVSSWTLVAPQGDHLSGEARARAANAVELLAQAKIEDTVESALSECEIIYGCSGRFPDLPQARVTAREAADQIVNHSTRKTAILFGNERSGLSAKTLQLCHYHIQIPANPAYPILNLAQAAQIVLYELFCAKPLQSNLNVPQGEQIPLASFQAMACFYAHLKTVMIQTRFLNPNNPKKLLERLRLLFNRAQLNEKEVNMLRGFLSSIER